MPIESTNKKTTLLIVDDQQIIVDGLILILSHMDNFERIEYCTNPANLLEKLETFSPDVILLDFNMPEIDGIQCLIQILKHYPKQKVLMLTGYDDTELIREALKKGALGYVLKNIAKEELITAIDTVQQGLRYLDQQVQNKVVEAFIQNTEAINGNVSELTDQMIKLSSREKEVLKLIADGKSSSKIADQLFISINTVDTHRKNIMAKCGVKKITELITFATKNQLI